MPNLPVPIPANEVPGNFITGAVWNANVYNGLTFLLNPPVFSGYQGTAQSIPQNAWTPLAIDNSTIDSYGGHSNSTNNSRYVAQVAGWYTVCGVYAPVGNTASFRGVRIQVNGSPILGAAAYMTPGAYSAELGCVTPTRDIYLNVNDYVEVAAWQNAATTLATVLDADLRSGLWLRFSHA
jgi:hypothetical protein